MPYIDPAQSAKILPPLHVNDGPLKPENVGYLRTTPKETPIDEVRQRLQEDGYALLKGILPRQDVLTAREAYFKHLAPSGVLKPDTAAVEGIFDDAKDKLHYPGIGAGVLDRRDNPSNPTARFIDLAISAHDEPWYKQDLCRHPDLIGFISRLTGWGENTLALQRTLLRNNTPGNKAIGVHYDQIFLRHGDDTVLTAWVPVGDVQLNGGGLIYLENGHKLGAEIESNFTKNAVEGGMTMEEAKNAFNQNMMSGGVLTEGPKAFGEEYHKRWLVSEYEAGDVVIHSSYAIHASTINHAEDGAIRLGTDLRFVDSSRPWDQRWTNVFNLDDGL